MKLSNSGEDMIVTFEGEVLKVYKDPVGLPTLGVGHLLTRAELRKYPVGTPISKSLSRQFFRQDLKKFEDALADLVTVPLTQNQYDALVSLSFNIGLRNFTGSSLLRKLNKQDYNGAADAFLLWVKAGNQTLHGLVTRRKAERKLFLAPEPQPVVSTGEVSETDGGGGTQTTPAVPPPIFSTAKASEMYEGAMGVVDKAADAQGRISRVSFNAGLGMKILAGLSAVFAYFETNWEFVVVAIGLVLVGLLIWYLSYRKSKTENA
jgi:lysozyme